MHVSSSLGVFYNRNAHYVIGGKWWNNSWRYYFWFFINHVVLWVMWYCFSRIKSLFMYLVWFCSVSLDTVIMTCTLSRISICLWLSGRHREIFLRIISRSALIRDTAYFCPNQTLQNHSVGGGGWRRVLSGNHVLHDESRICKTLQIWTPKCAWDSAWRMHPVFNSKE